VPLEAAQLHLDDGELGELVFDAVVSGPDDGEPVLLLHGWPQTSLSWGRVMPALASSGIRCAALDQRGYSPGARPSEVSAYALPHLVEDTVGAIEALGWESAHVVGHDWGAVVAWALAARRPELVRSLTALSVPHPRAFDQALRTDPVQWKKSAYLGLFRASPRRAAQLLLRDGAAPLRGVYAGAVHKADVARYVEHFSQDDALEASLRWYGAMGAGKFGEVPAVTVPTTYVWGTEDVALGARAARGCARWCLGPFEFRVLNGRGHWLPDEDPDAVVDAILARVP